MLEAKNVVKTFDGFRALDGLTMTVPKGAVYGLVGPNGAGKSTIIRHLAGIYRQDSGEVLLDGQPVYESPAVKRRMTGIGDVLFSPGQHPGDGPVLRRDVPRLQLGAVRKAEAGVPTG